MKKIIIVIHKKISEDEKVSNNNKKGTKLHTIKSKIKIANYAENHSIKDGMIKYNIPRTILNEWLKNKNKFLSLDSNKLMKTTIYKGGKPLNIEVEDKLISFAITTFSL